MWEQSVLTPFFVPIDSRAFALPNPPKKSRRKLLWITLCILLLLCVAGWFWLNATVKSTIESQLIAAGIEAPKVGHVSTGFGGFTAKNIQFEINGTSVSLNELEVQQSILDLARGVEPMDAIRFQGGNVSIDAQRLDGDSSFSFADLDLAKVQLPTRQISADNLTLRLYDEGGAVEVSIADSVLSATEDEFELNGAAEFLDGKVTFGGSVSKQSSDLSVDFNGKKLHLADQKWQDWPGMGPAIKKHLGADSVFDVVGSLDGNLKTGIKYKADVTTKDAKLYIPRFDLPIAIRSAEVLIQDGLVTYKNVVAAMGDRDVTNATGTTTIDGLPCVSKFQGNFTNTNVADLRKLVKQIPDKVVGTATGKVTGSVIVDEALDTELRLSAAGDTDDAFYGEIKADSGFVDVQIQPLVISPVGKTLDLQGSVTVDASTKQQNVDGVLQTFDLKSLDEQFEFEMLGDGEVDLVIPLNSAADLRTWKLDIASTAESGSVGGMPLEELQINAFLQNGQLVFQPASARQLGKPDSKLAVNVTWPMPNRAAKQIGTTGKVVVAAQGLPPGDAAAFFSRQMLNAGIDYKLKPQVDQLAKSDIDGVINFDARIQIPASSERPVESWIVDASVSNSKLSYANETVEEMAASIAIRNGHLSLTDLTGNVTNGGGIKANASINLSTNALHDVALVAKDFPATWLANAIVKQDTSGKFVSRTGLDSDNVTVQLSGLFDAELKMDPNKENNVLWKAHSNELTIFGNPFTNVDAEGHYDTQLDIERIDVSLPGGGEAHLNGDWIAASDQGQFKLKWKDAQLVPLLESQLQLPESFSSLSDGDLDITFRNTTPEYFGVVELVEPKLFGGTLANHRFKVSTEEGRVHFREMPDKATRTVALLGSFATQSPFEFEVKGKANSLPLSTSVLDKLSGRATMDFQISGQASPWKVRSSGKSMFQRLRFDKSKLSDIRANWNFDTSNPQAMDLTLEGLGGKASLDPVLSQSKNLVFNIDNLQLSELTAIRKLPVEFSGEVSGSATVENWEEASQRSLVLKGQSKVIRVGNARLNRTKGTATLSNGGKDLEYSFEGQLIDGKLEGFGKAEIASISDPFATMFPLKLKLSNGRLNRFAESISQTPVQALNDLKGRVSASMDWEVVPGEYPKGSGQVLVDDIKYRNRQLSRRVRSDISLDNGVVRLNRLSAELQQGEISGQATIPLVGSASGNYRLDVRNFSLSRLLYVLVDDPIEASGVVNAKISGRTGQSITGTGTLGVSQAGLFGVRSESMNIPLRFRVNPGWRSAKIEMPKSRVKAFRGTIDGSASMELGSRLQIETDLELVNIDSQTFVRSVTGYQKPGTGKLSGTLEISAGNYRSEKDLAGSFRGNLKQSNALALPLLDKLSRFLGNVGAFRNDRFESDAIVMTLAKGKINIAQFRLQNALTSILITGDAWLNGKLDLEVAARVERLNQPTLIDQLAGSPVARAAGPQATFFIQAADFLSERIVFLDVAGTASRPQFRLNPGKQLKEEAIRYFLRGSQILPNANGPNN